jgi:hypothetical protein
MKTNKFDEGGIVKEINSTSKDSFPHYSIYSFFFFFFSFFFFFFFFTIPRVFATIIYFIVQKAKKYKTNTNSNLPPKSFLSLTNLVKGTIEVLFEKKVLLENKKSPQHPNIS